MIPVLIESALRALLVALTVWAGLRLFRVTNVLAQKAAWSLVLVCAVAMPMVMRLQVLPPSMGFKIPATSWRLTAESLPIRDAVLMSAQAEGLMSATRARVLAEPETRQSSVELSPGRVLLNAPFDQPAQVMLALAPKALTPRPEAPQAQTPPAQIQLLQLQPEEGTLLGWIGDLAAGLHLPELGNLAAFLYFAICGVLLARIAYGLNLAMDLWQRAEVFVPYPQDDPGYGLGMRFSRAVSSPVTIGSGVLLPYECLEWDGEKLRIVLAHERAHIRHGDFYLQLLAGLYSSVFWFSPLGWWLKRALCDLSEAVSDHAGLEEAASRASYAQVLLEFAALPRPTAIGVAMARSTNLSQRIERLLNESSFRQAFAGTRRRLLLVLLLVPVALFAGTALIRVEAASSGRAVQSTPPPAAPDAAIAPEPAAAPNPAEPRVARDPAVPPPAMTAVMPLAPMAPESAVVPPAVPSVAAVPPVPPMAAVVAEYREVHDSADDHVAIIANDQDDSVSSTNSDTKGRHVSRSMGKGYSYSYSNDGETWALVTDPSDRVTFSGDWHDSTRDSLKKVRQLTNGKFLWFTHDGKSYFIDDPTTIAQIQEMYKPMEALSRQQEILGKQQEELGRQQEEFGRKQEQASIPTPDISKEMAELNAAVAKLNAKKGGTVNEEQISEIEGKIGDIQGKLGELQGEVGEKQGELGEQQGRLGEQQGKLGEQQGRLGEQQGKIAEEADRKIKSIIADSLRSGKARPVQ